MKASEIVLRLQELIKEHGDLIVREYDRGLWSPVEEITFEGDEQEDYFFYAATYKKQ